MDKYINLSSRFDQNTSYHYKSLCLEITAMYRTLQRSDEIKLVIFDLDGTLWRGVPAENNILTNEGWPAGIQEAILILANRGIILAICSKNDSSFIENNWKNLTNNRIPYDIFAIKQINFNNKSDNIQNILITTNILPSNVLFIDDNPRERDLVKSAFPEIRVMGEDVLFWKKCLLTSSELQPILFTPELMKKNDSIKIINEIKKIRKEMSNEEFLQSLNLKLHFVKSKDEHTARIFELINKTNQFNSIGKKYSIDDIKNLIYSGNIYHGHVIDNFSDYGLVIAAIINNNIIEHLIMSCRCFNLEIEIAFLIILFNLFNINNNMKIKFKSSSKNNPILQSLINFGFNMFNINKEIVLEYSISKEEIKNTPYHIFITFDL
jgi:FkbH-like protein